MFSTINFLGDFNSSLVLVSLTENEQFHNFSYS